MRNNQEAKKAVRPLYKYIGAESSLKFNIHISKNYNKFKMWLVRLNLMGGLLYQVLRALND